MGKPRKSQLPPEAANWHPEEEPPGGLLYLGWGNRFYGKHPITPSSHEGWTYMVILEGTPTLVTNAGSRRMSAASLLLIGPDIAHGWKDHAGSRTFMLSWVWRRGPELPGWKELSADTLWIECGRRPTLDVAEAIHRDSREEVHLSDNFSGEMLAACKVRLDTLFGRAGGPGATSTSRRDEQRMRLAGEWMGRHLDARSPAAGLADYLGISAIELHRLFRKQAGESPGRLFHAFKMRQARARLREKGSSVKAVGFDLGYRNPGDFTRAYSRHYGHPPSADL